jgi:pimeloyl-ACP methyl ester carboxylesterase
MFSETRYAMNGDLRVAYRASREGPRDIVFVPTWFTNCEVFPELPSIQGWVEAMTSLGRLIVLDQPGTGASDPVTSDTLPTLEQWADSITAVLDDLGSREAVLLANVGALAPAALFAAREPVRDEHDVARTFTRCAIGDAQVPVQRIARLREHCGSVSRGAVKFWCQASSPV